MASDGGKGSAPRPKDVDKETFANNWELVFGKKRKQEPVDKSHYFQLYDVPSSQPTLEDERLAKIRAVKGAILHSVITTGSLETALEVRSLVSIAKLFEMDIPDIGYPSYYDEVLEHILKSNPV